MIPSDVTTISTRDILYDGMKRRTAEIIAAHLTSIQHHKVDAVIVGYVPDHAGKPGKPIMALRVQYDNTRDDSIDWMSGFVSGYMFRVNQD